MKVLGRITVRTLPVNREGYRAGEPGLSGKGAASPGEAGQQAVVGRRLALCAQAGVQVFK